MIILFTLETRLLSEKKNNRVRQLHIFSRKLCHEFKVLIMLRDYYSIITTLGGMGVCSNFFDGKLKGASLGEALFNDLELRICMK